MIRPTAARAAGRSAHAAAGGALVAALLALAGCGQILGIHDLPDEPTGSGGVLGGGQGGHPGSGGHVGGVGGAAATGGSGAGGSTVGSGGSTIGAGGSTAGTGGSTIGAGGSTMGTGGRGTGGMGVGGNFMGTGGRGTGGMGTGGAGTGGRGTGGMPGTGGMGTGGSVTLPPPLTSGTSGWASRYWDCCKPACGWTGNVSGGTPMMSCNMQNQSLGSNYDAPNACTSGGTAYMCWDAVPWQVAPTLSYGFAAASSNNYVCGRCYQIQFNGTAHTGSNAGATSLNGKTMIVQVTNNGGVASDQFDLLIPGGGVGALNACSTQWGTTNLGSQYGGFLTGCGGDTSCVRTMCQNIFGTSKPDLMAGCNWFLDWFNAADNPAFIFKSIACPAAITAVSGLHDPGPGT